MQLKFLEIYLQLGAADFKKRDQATEHYPAQLARKMCRMFLWKSAPHPQELKTQVLKTGDFITMYFHSKGAVHSENAQIREQKQKNQSSTSQEYAIVPGPGFADSSDMNSTTDL